MKEDLQRLVLDALIGRTVRFHMMANGFKEQGMVMRARRLPGANLLTHAAAAAAIEAASLLTIGMEMKEGRR